MSDWAQVDRDESGAIVHEAARDKHGQTVCGLAFEAIRKGDKVVAGAVRRTQVTCATCIVVDELGGGSSALEPAGPGAPLEPGANGPAGPAPEQLEQNKQAARARLEQLRRDARDGKLDPQLHRIGVFLAGGFAAQAAVDRELRRLERADELPPGAIDTVNEFCVASWSDGLTLLCPPLPRQKLSRVQALTLAAWLVAIGEENEGDFARYLNAVQNT